MGTADAGFVTGRAVEDLHAEVLARLRRLRGEQVGLGRLLLELRREDAYFRLGASTFAIYCEQVGLSAQEGHELAAMAQAAEVRPEVSGLVASAALSVQKAATVAEVLLQPALQKPCEDWLLKAAEHSTRDLRDLVKQRKEEVRLAGNGPPERPVELRLFVSPRSRDGFTRCKELASRRAGRMLTESHTFELVVDEYLLRHDPLRGDRGRQAGSGRRRGAGAVGAEAAGGPAAGGPAASGEADRTSGRLAGDCAAAAVDAASGSGERSRHVRAAVRREVLDVHGDRCWVENCDRRVHLEFAHREPFSRGGGSEAGDLERLCRDHHMQRDGQRWRLRPRRDGVLLMIDGRGVVVGRYRRAETAAADAKPPP